MKKKYFWSIILSWIFILSSCSQEKCEDEVGNQYQYRVEIIENNSIIDVKFCDYYFQLYEDSVVSFSYDICDKGQRKTENFKLKPGTFEVYPL